MGPTRRSVELWVRFAKIGVLACSPAIVQPTVAGTFCPAGSFCQSGGSVRARVQARLVQEDGSRLRVELERAQACMIAGRLASGRGRGEMTGPWDCAARLRMRRQPCHCGAKPIARRGLPAHIGCGSTSLREPRDAPVAQLDRAPDYESGGQEFESLRARHLVLICEPDSAAARPARTARSSTSVLHLMRIWRSSTSTISMRDCR